MGKIYFKQHYTMLVEHFFRLGVRYEYTSKVTPKSWFLFTKEWIKTQPAEDVDFLNFIFGKEFTNPVEGMYCYKRRPGTGSETAVASIDQMKRRLFELERSFAVAAGLINDISFDHDNENE